MGKIDTPCPFCGQYELHYETYENFNTKNIFCGNCDAYFINDEDVEVQSEINFEIIEGFLNILKKVNR